MKFSQEKFKEAQFSIIGDEELTTGVALQAAILQGDTDEKELNLSIFDVTHLSLGRELIKIFFLQNISCLLSLILRQCFAWRCDENSH